MRIWTKNLFQTIKDVAEESTQVVEFEPTAGFKGYRRLFVKDSVKHPAKANLHMIKWIIEKWTQKGRWITITSEALEFLDKNFDWCQHEKNL